MSVKIESWGYGWKYEKRRLPDWEEPPSDLELDVRIITDPWGHHLLGATHNGLEKEVQDYVLEHAEAQAFVEEAVNFAKKADDDITIAFVCNWGRHRSVSCAEETFRRLKDEGIDVTMEHLTLRYADGCMPEYEAGYVGREGISVA